MLKMTSFSPTQPRRAETRFLLKRRSQSPVSLQHTPPGE